jgi:hypothetical protein
VCSPNYGNETEEIKYEYGDQNNILYGIGGLSKKEIENYCLPF